MALPSGKAVDSRAEPDTQEITTVNFGRLAITSHRLGYELVKETFAPFPLNSVSNFSLQVLLGGIVRRRRNLYDSRRATT